MTSPEEVSCSAAQDLHEMPLTNIRSDALGSAAADPQAFSHGDAACSAAQDLHETPLTDIRSDALGSAAADPQAFSHGDAACSAAQDLHETPRMNPHDTVFYSSALDPNEERLRAAIDHAAQVLLPSEKAAGLSDKLLKAFGTPSHAVEAPEKDLKRLCQLPDKVAFSLSMTLPVARYMLNELAAQSNTVVNVDQARMRLLPVYLGAHYECGHMICLTKDGRFLSCSPLRMGSVDEAPFYMRIIIETALNSGGDCFVIAHNHPGGSRIASADDCASTLHVLDAMSQLGLILIDHLVIADGEAVSIRKTGSIAARIWNKLAPFPEAFKNWLR